MRPLSVEQRLSLQEEWTDIELTPPPNSVFAVGTTLFSGVRVNYARVPLPVPTKNV